jgi:crotonobetainyl-CoA:carnitine CoA-transferase CaiB-like acyl-CoA transferase
MVVEVDYGDNKKLNIVGNPIKLSEVGQEVFKRPPYLGEHTEEILRELLNYSPQQIEAIKKEKIV